MSDVYFVGAASKIKIGFTGNLSERLFSLQTGCPERLELLATIHGCLPSVEKHLHQFFARFRLQGEWFARNGGLLEFIECIRGGAQPRTPEAIEHVYYFAIHPSRRDAARRVIADGRSEHEDLRAAHILLRRLSQARKLHFEN